MAFFKSRDKKGLGSMLQRPVFADAVEEPTPASLSSGDTAEDKYLPLIQFLSEYQLIDFLDSFQSRNLTLQDLPPLLSQPDTLSEIFSPLEQSQPGVKTYFIKSVQTRLMGITPETMTDPSNRFLPLQVLLRQLQLDAYIMEFVNRGLVVEVLGKAVMENYATTVMEIFPPGHRVNREKFVKAVRERFYLPEVGGSEPPSESPESVGMGAGGLSVPKMAGADLLRTTDGYDHAMLQFHSSGVAGTSSPVHAQQHASPQATQPQPFVHHGSGLLAPVQPVEPVLVSPAGYHPQVAQAGMMIYPQGGGGSVLPGQVPQQPQPQGGSADDVPMFYL